MIEVRKTASFDRWLLALRDPGAAARIKERIRRVEVGSFGDTRSVGGGVEEMRIHYGPGYRIYFARFGARVVLLLAGGDKRHQWRDIKRAIRLRDGLEDD
ncbi:MAG TPA: type II toxin-antitoxin system RelE/ParE family toxin [Coriobacteriia bacterium]